MTYKTTEQKKAEFHAAVMRQVEQRRTDPILCAVPTTLGDQLRPAAEVCLTLAQLQELSSQFMPTNQFGRNDAAAECGMYCYDSEPLALLARGQWRRLGYEVGALGYYEEPGLGEYEGEMLQSWTLDVSAPCSN